MAILANKENETVFRLPKTPLKTAAAPLGFMKTPIGSKKGAGNNENRMHLSIKKAGLGGTPPLNLGNRTVLGGKTNVYKSGALSGNAKGKQFIGSTLNPAAATTTKTNPFTEDTTVETDKEHAVKENNKYDMEIEFIPTKVSPLPYRPLDEIELDYEQLGRACRGRGQVVNFDDTFDKPLAEFMAELTSPSDEENDHFEDEMDFLVKSSPLNLNLKQARAGPLPVIASESIETSDTRHQVPSPDHAKDETIAEAEAAMERQLKRKPSHTQRQQTITNRHNKKLAVHKPVASTSLAHIKTHVVFGKTNASRVSKSESGSGSSGSSSSSSRSKSSGVGTSRAMARFMAPTISAAAKAKNAASVSHTTAARGPRRVGSTTSRLSSSQPLKKTSDKTSTSNGRVRPNTAVNIFSYENHQEYISPIRAAAADSSNVTVPESPSSDFDFDNQVDLPTLEQDMEELEKDLL
ncbi:hypothetical protein, no similarity [Geotrichum candidum]|uniref:Uncharacterized protein n=1 Tax=Geotrichum candidum TaxID=1173061 RepID=A0A0J9XKQ4_GEOCN|nr:hypothetical protein, no similarity [Geotrichum candidum]